MGLHGASMRAAFGAGNQYLITFSPGCSNQRFADIAAARRSGRSFVLLFMRPCSVSALHGTLFAS
jgi:hypothetical protein